MAKVEIDTPGVTIRIDDELGGVELDARALALFRAAVAVMDVLPVGPASGLNTGLRATPTHTDPNYSSGFGFSPRQGWRRMMDEEIKVHNYCIPISPELLDDALPPFSEMLARLQEEQRQFLALPPGEQKRILAERAAAEAAAKAERTCSHCGCDPDEHGGY